MKREMEHYSILRRFYSLMPTKRYERAGHLPPLIVSNLTHRERDLDLVGPDHAGGVQSDLSKMMSERKRAFAPAEDATRSAPKANPAHGGSR